MATIAILPEEGEDNLTTFSAVTAEHKATGRTAGEALDALTAQLSPEEAGAHVIIQPFQPDQLFPAAQRDRLSALMARWRAARETGEALPPGEQAELERLINEEVEGSAQRTAQILRDSYAEKLTTRREEKSQSNSRTDLAVFIVGILCTMLPIVVLLYSIPTAIITILISSVVGSVIGQIYFWREARQRAASLSGLTNSLPDRVEHGEQTRAQ